MPRESESHPFGDKIFADTQPIKCRNRSSGEHAQALRFSSTLGNYHALDQWTRDVPIWWEPEAETLRVGDMTLAKGDYLVAVGENISQMSEPEFHELFDTRESAIFLGAAYAGPNSSEFEV